MRKTFKNPLFQAIVLWTVFTVNLVVTFFLGIVIASFPLAEVSIGCLLTVVILIFVDCRIVLYYNNTSKAKKEKRVFICIFLILNLGFALVIGLSIPFMETLKRENLGFVMIPLLVLLNIVIVDRFHFYLKYPDGFKIDDNVEIVSRYDKKKKRPVIEFEGKKYQFSIQSLALLAVGAPLTAYIVYIIFDNEINYWLHEIVVKQTSFFLNFFFDMGTSVQYNPSGKYHWMFEIPGKIPIYFETFCTGVQAICIFVGIIVFTPHSKDARTKKDIVWRKTKSLIVSSVIFYVVNIIRMLIQLQLYYSGYPWEDIHYSISAASSFIVVIIVLLLHKWIPEFIISFIYVGSLISEPIKAKRMKQITDQVNEHKKASLELLSKVMGMKKQMFLAKFPKLMKELRFEIADNHILVPTGRKSEFLEGLNNQFKLNKKSKEPKED
ncbi:MAG: archaeosortase H [Promethearchaeota archaeon]